VQDKSRVNLAIPLPAGLMIASNARLAQW